MNNQSIPVGRVFGIPLRIDYSWFLIFALVTWTLATGYFPAEFKGWPAAEYWMVGVITAVIFFASVLLHELGHSVVAMRYKIEVNSITLLIFGGVSEIKSEPVSALSEFWITISGPIVSLVLAGIFALLALLFSGVEPLLALTKYLAYINLLLGAFNLIPGFPLDGGGVLMSIVWGITHKRHLGVVVATTVGSSFAYLFIALGAYQVLGGNFLNGLWTVFIGWFLLNASGGEARREKIKSSLSGHKVSEAMSRGYTIIPADTTLQYLVDEHILGGSRRSFIIQKDDAVVGLLTMHALQSVPKEKWPTTCVDQVMIPTGQVKQISPDTEIWEAIEKMDRDGVNQLPVMLDSQIQGILTREDVISYIRSLSSGGRRPDGFSG
jgi:Zn-dependent protease/predicted transcriptional regulator